MEISTELLVADLAQKLRRGLIKPHGLNLEDDIRAAIVLAQKESQAENSLQIALALAQHRANESARLIADCQAVLAEWIVPDSGITDTTVLSNLLQLLDGPRSRELLPIETSTFLTRLRDEKAQLADRIDKLKTFASSPRIIALDSAQQELLTKQLHAMEIYDEILRVRLSLIDKPQAGA